MLFPPCGHRTDAIKSSHWLPPFCECVCVCDVKRIVGGGGAKWYMSLGPSVSEADSSFIRRYYTKQCTPTRAHTRTFGTQMHHTKPGEERATEPGCLGGWSVFTSRIHLGWSMRMGIIITSLGSDSQYRWHRLSQYFRKGQDRLLLALS